eukprot:1603719-Amphidinium_carterae.1
MRQQTIHAKGAARMGYLVLSTAGMDSQDKQRQPFTIRESMSKAGQKNISSTSGLPVLGICRKLNTFRSKGSHLKAAC